MTVLGMMGVILVAALVCAGFLERDKRYGSGKSHWLAARRLGLMARFDARTARELRECAREHSPWDVRFQRIAARSPLAFAMGRNRRP